jgi:hypothetical protein
MDSFVKIIMRFGILQSLYRSCQLKIFERKMRKVGISYYFLVALHIRFVTGNVVVWSSLLMSIDWA